MNASGDFNGDGVTDLVFAATNGGTVGSSLYLVTLLGSKGGTPTQVATPVTIACDIGSMVAADLNNDKKLDVLVTCFEGTQNYVMTFLGNGDGSFAAPVESDVSASTGFALADFNGDGLPDLAFPTAPPPFSGLDPGFSVALNTGGGRFGKPTFYSIPPLGGSLIFGPLGAGDFNGDGKQDLFVGGSQGAYLLGNGDGTFAAPQVVSNNVGSFVVADFNHDGFSDVAYATPSSLVLLSGGTSGLTSPGISTPIPASSVIQLFAADLIGNGSLSVIAQTAVEDASGTLNTLVFLPNGTNGFSAPTSYATQNFFGLADVNGDRFLDLVGATTTNGSSLSFALGNGDGTFAALPNTPNGGSSQQFASADMNGDGLTDAVLFDTNGNPLVFLANGNGRFVATPNVGLPLPAHPATIPITADFNGDGKPDVVSIQPGFNSSGNAEVGAGVTDAAYTVYLGNGDGTLTFRAQTTLSIYSVQAAVAGDFDGDKKQDLVIIYSAPFFEQTGAVFLHGNGDGTFANPVPITLLGNQPMSLAATDLNGDGIEDLVIGDDSPTGPSIEGYLGSANGTFTPAAQSLAVFSAQMAAVDVTGDGKPDLITLSGVYSGNGDGTFSASPVFQFPLGPGNILTNTGIAVGDLNGDGLPDIGVFSNLGIYITNGLNIFLNGGNGTFTEDPTTYFGGSPSITVGIPAVPLAFVRLNPNEAASGTKLTLDALAYDSGGLTSLLNQTNAAPKPAPVITVSLANGISSLVSGTNATITAQLSNTLSTAPTGTVQFYAGGSPIGTAALTGSTASVTAPITGSGQTTIRAVYSGDANYSSVFGFASVNVTSPTTVMLTTSAVSVNEQQSVTLTASVTGASPSGTITFLNGTASLGSATLSNGTASLTTSFATAGTFSITASYGGDTVNLASTSAAVAITILAPDFAISSTPASASVSPGQSAVFTFTVTPSGGFNSAVTFSCSTPLPSGVNCAFSSLSVTPSNGQPATTQLTISTTAPSAAFRKISSARNSGGPWLPGKIIVSVAGVLGFFFGRKRLTGSMQRNAVYFLILPALACLLLLSSCGGNASNNGNTTPTNPGTPAGNMTVTVTASAAGSGPQHGTAVTLAIN